MSNDNPTFAEIAEDNIRQYRRKHCEEDCECEQRLIERAEQYWEDSRDAYD